MVVQGDHCNLRKVVVDNTGRYPMIRLQDPFGGIRRYRVIQKFERRYGVVKRAEPLVWGGSKWRYKMVPSGSWRYKKAVEGGIWLYLAIHDGRSQMILGDTLII